MVRKTAPVKPAEHDNPDLDETPTDDQPDAEAGEGETTDEGTGKRKYTRVSLPPVPLDALTFDEVPEDEWDSHPLTEGPARDEAQQTVDAKVKGVYDAWVTAEKPAVRKSPRGRFTVAPNLAPSVRHMIGSAGRLHEVAVKINPPKHDANGHEIIVFTVRDKATRKTTNTEGESSES